MTSKTTLRRLQVLELRPPPPSACRAAIRAYREDGTMPTHPGLRLVVERVIGVEQEARALVTVVDAPGKREGRE